MNLVLVLAAWAALYEGGDTAALPTLLLFGPRWVVALPLLALVPLAGWVRSYWAAGLSLAAGLVVAGPVTGGTVAAGRLVRPDRPGLVHLRVVTWNTGGSRTGPAFRDFLAQNEPHVVLLQEATQAPDAAVLPKGWKVFGRGGTKLASPYPVREDGLLDWRQLGAAGEVSRFVVETPDGEVTVVNVHLPTVRPGLEAALHSKLRDLRPLREVIETRAAASRRVRAWVGDPAPSLMVAGDFNMPDDSRIYLADWAAFRNAFADAGTGWGTTKQTHWFGARIDHILYSSPWQCRTVRIGPAMGSDHRPVVAHLAWREAE